MAIIFIGTFPHGIQIQSYVDFDCVYSSASSRSTLRALWSIAFYLVYRYIHTLFKKIRIIYGYLDNFPVIDKETNINIFFGTNSTGLPTLTWSALSLLLLVACLFPRTQTRMSSVPHGMVWAWMAWRLFEVHVHFFGVCLTQLSQLSFFMLLQHRADSTFFAFREGDDDGISG